VSDFAARHDAAPDDAREFVTAVGEALANAIEHSRSADPIVITCRRAQDAIVATIVDSGSGFHPAERVAAELPPEFAERGRGLPIMRRCSDIFEVRSAPGRGTEVTLGRYLRRRHAFASRQAVMTPVDASYGAARTHREGQ
jgi:anti-sigma regulatory factor (Ser/Thr protein kinase)